MAATMVFPFCDIGLQGFRVGCRLVHWLQFSAVIRADFQLVYVDAFEGTHLRFLLGRPDVSTFVLR